MRWHLRSSICMAVTLSALAVLTGSLRAAIVTWDGSTDATWDEVTNWDGDAEPASDSDVVLPTPVPGTGATIALTSGELANSLSFQDSYTLSGGDLTLTTGGISVATATTATIGSSLLGTSGVVKSGAGTLVLTGVNTYTGGTRIDDGTVRVGNSSALGTNSLYLTSTAAVLDLNGYDVSVNGLWGNPSDQTQAGTILNNGLTSAVLTVGAGNSSSRFYGNITDGTGVLGLSVTGSGVTSLFGVNTFSGGLYIIGGGTVRTDSNAALGANGGNITFSDALAGGKLEVATANLNGRYNVDGIGTIGVATGLVSSFTGNLTGAGTLIKSGGGELLILTNTDNFTGDLVLGYGALDAGTTANVRLLATAHTSRPTGTLHNVDSITIEAGSQLQIDYSRSGAVPGLDFINDAADVYLKGGYLYYSGPYAAAGNEVIGDVSAVQGPSLITSFHTRSTGSATLTLSSLSSEPGAVVFFAGNGTLGTGNSKILISTRETSSYTGLLGGSYFTVPATTRQDFAWYTAGSGVTPMTDSNYAIVTSAAGADSYFTSSNNVKLEQTSGNLNFSLPAGSYQINSLSMHGSNYTGTASGQQNLTLTGSNLNITSGGVIVGGNTSTNALNYRILGGNITSSGGNLTFYTHTNRTLLLTSNITNSGATPVSVTKVGAGTMAFNQTFNSNYTGGTYILGGSVTTLATDNVRYFGDGQVFVNDALLILSGNLATGYSAGPDYVALNGGQIYVNRAQSSENNWFSIDGNSVIQGSTTNLASLTYNNGTLVTGKGKVDLADGAIVGHMTALTTAVGASNTYSIQNLPQQSKYYYGLGVEQNSATGNLTIGDNTPWMGIASNRTSLRWRLGAVTIANNSGDIDVYLRGLALPNSYPSGGTNVTLQLGLLADTGGMVMNLTNPGTANVNIVGLVQSNNQFMSFGNPASGRYVAFQVTPGAYFDLNSASALGSGANLANVTVQAGGSLRVGNVTAVNGDIVVRPDGRFIANSAGLEGSGQITFREGSIVQITNAMGFTGTQALNSLGRNDTIVRLLANVGTASSRVLGDGTIFNGTPVFEMLLNETPVDPTSNPGAVLLLNSVTRNKGVLTNDFSDRNWVATATAANAWIDINATNGGTVAATTGTYLQVQEDVRLNGGTLYVGYNGSLNGYEKLGRVGLQDVVGDATLGGTIQVVGGAEALALAAWNNSANVNMVLESGARFDVDNAVVLRNVTGTGNIVGDSVLTIGEDSNFTFDGVLGNTTNAALRNTVGLRKVGSGTLNLTQSAISIGATTINAGTIRLGADEAMTHGTLTLGDATAGTSGLLVLNGFNQEVRGLAAAGPGGSIVNGSDTIITLTVNSAAATAFNGTLGSATAGNDNNFNFVKKGTSTLTLNGTNYYTGTTEVQNGILVATTLGNVNGGGSALGAPTSTAAGTITLGSSGDATAGTLRVDGATAPITDRDLVIAYTGSGLSANGTVGSPLTWAGSISGLSGDVILTLNGNNTDDNTIAGTISDGTATSLGVTKLGAGKWILGAGNTYTGLTTVTTGTLAYGADDALGSGNVLVNGGTLDLGAYSDTIGQLTVSSGTVSGAGTLTSTAGPIVISAGTVSAVLAGDVGLLKNTTGTATLSGLNTYTGQTIVEQGTLIINTIGNVGGGASSLGAPTTVGSGTIVLGNATVGSTLRFDGTAASSTDRDLSLAFTAATLSANGTAGSTLTWSGTINSSNSGDVVFTLNGNNTGDNTITGLIENGSASSLGLTKLGAGKWILAPSGGPNTFSGLTTVTTGTLAYGANDALGSGDVLVNGGTLALGAYSDTIGRLTVSSGTVSGTGTLTSTAGPIVISAGTVSAVLAGDVGLLKNTTGTATLSGLNTYTGQTIVEQGTLIINTIGNVGGGASSLGAPTTVGSGTIVLGNATVGSTLRFDGTAASSTDRDLSLAFTAATLSANGTAGSTLTWSGTINSSNSGDVVFTLNGNNTGDNTITGLIENGSASSLGLTKLGAGKWILAPSGGPNTFSGLTTVTTGTLAYGANDALGSGDVLVNGGTLALGAYSDTIGRLTVSSGTVSGTGTLTSTAGPIVVSAGTVSAVLAGDVGLLKNTTGTATLSALNAYTGQTIVEQGTLIINTIGNVGGGASSLGAPTTVGNGAIVLGNATVGSTLQWEGATANVTDRNLSLAFTAATLSANGTAPITLGGTIDSTNTGAVVLTLAGNSGALNTITGVIDEGSASSLSLVKIDSGRWVLDNASNAFSGSPILIKDGALGFTSAGALNGAAVTVGDTATLGTLEYAGSSSYTFTQALTLTGLGGGIGSSGTGNVTLSSDVFTKTAAATLVLSGINTGDNLVDIALTDNIGGASTGALSLVKRNAGKWILNKANSYTGETTISGGELVFTNSQSFANVTLGGEAGLWANMTLGSGVTATMAGTNVTYLATNNGLGSVISGGTVGLGSTARNLVIGDSTNAPVDLEIASKLTGTTGFTKSGAGTLRLSNDTNDFTGQVTLTGGTVQATSFGTVGSASALGTSGTVNVTGAARLEYVGSGETSNLNLVMTGANATLAASGTGTLTFTGTVSSTDSGRRLLLSGTGDAILASNLAFTRANADLYKDGTGTWTITAAQYVDRNIHAGNHGAALGSSGILAGNVTYAFGRDEVDTLYSRRGAIVALNAQGAYVGAALNVEGGQVDINVENAWNDNGGYLAGNMIPTTLSITAGGILNLNQYSWYATSLTFGTTGWTSGVSPLTTGEINGDTASPADLYVVGGIAATGNATVPNVTGYINPGVNVVLTTTAAATRTVTTNLSGTSLNIGGNLTETSGFAATLQKLGSGTLRLAGTNSYTGATLANAGTLILDYTSNTGDKLADAAELRIAGATVQLLGNATENIVETVGSANITGRAEVVLTSAAGQDLTFNLNTITRSQGGALRVSYDNTAGGTSTVTTDNQNVNGILGGWLTVYNPATGSYDWGYNADDTMDGAIRAYTGYVSTFNAGDNTNVTAGVHDLSAGSPENFSNSLRFNDGSGAATVILPSTGVSLLASGGVMVTPTVGANDITITGGALTVDGLSPYELFLLQNNPSGNLIIESPIVNYNAGSSAVSLSKHGVGKVVLAAANTYGGATYVTNGALELGVDNALPITTVVTLGDSDSAGILRLAGHNQQLAGLLTNANAIGAPMLNKVVNDSATHVTLTVANPIGMNYIFGGVLGGSTANENNFSLVKAGGGTLTLNATESFTGTTTVWGGNLALNYSPYPTQKLATANRVILDGGILHFNMTTLNAALTQTVAGLTIDGGGSIVQLAGNSSTNTDQFFNFNGSSALTTRNAFSTINFQVSGNMTTNRPRISLNDGNAAEHLLGGWAVYGTGTAAHWAALAANRNLIAPTAMTVNPMTAEDTLSAWTSGINVDEGTSGYLGSLGADLEVNSIRFSRDVTGSNTVGNVNLGGRTLTVISGGILSANTGSTIAADKRIANGTLTSGMASGELFIHQYSWRNLFINATIADNGGTPVSLIKAGTGAGPTFLYGANTYTGDTYLQAGELRLYNTLGDAGVAGALGAGSAIHAGSIGTVGLYYYNAAPASTNRFLDLYAGNVSLANNNTVATNVLTWTGGINSTTVGPKTLQLYSSAGAGVNVISGAITDGVAGSQVSVRSLTGNWSLTGANTYTGYTEVGGGVLHLGANNILNSSNALVVSASGLLNVGDYDQTLAGTLTMGGAAGTPTITLNNGSLSIGDVVFNAASNPSALISSSGTGQIKLGAVNRTFTIGDGTALADMLITAPITGTGGVIKNGAGTLVLNGLNTYTGETRVNAGTLTVAATLNGSTRLSVNGSGSLLTLSGGITNPGDITSVTVGDGATLSLLDGAGNKLTSINTLALGSLQGAASTFNLNVGDGSSTGDELNTDLLRLIAGGTLKLYAGNKVYFNLTDAGLNGSTTYTLLQSVDGGLTSGVLSATDWVLGATPGGFTSITLAATDNAISITTGTLITGSMYWTGDVTGTPNTQWNESTDNWALNKDGSGTATSLPGAGTDVFFIADSVTGGAAVSTTLEQNFKINSLTFEPSTTPANTPASVTIASGAGVSRLEIAPQFATDGIKISTGGPASVTISSGVKIGRDQTWTVEDAASTLTLGSLFGAADVTKAGPGKVVLSQPADATFNTAKTSDVTVNAGTLEMSNAGALGSVVNDNLANIAVNGGVFYLNSATASVVANPITFGALGGTLSAGGATQTYSSVTAIDGPTLINMRNANSATLTDTARSITINSTFSGSGSITVDSVNTLTGGNMYTGTLTLGGANSGWSGDLILTRGTITATDVNALGTGDITASAGRIIFNSAEGTTFNLAQDINVTADGGILELSADASGTPTSDMTVNLSGVITVGSTSSANALRFTLASDEYSVINVTNSIVMANTTSITAQGSTTRELNISADISDGGSGYGLNINDEQGAWGGTSRAVRLTGVNTFSGNLLVKEGTLLFSTVSNVGGAASSLGQGADITLGGSTLTFVGGTSQSTDRSLILTGNSTLSSNGTSGTSITYTSPITAYSGTTSYMVTLNGASLDNLGFITGGIVQTLANNSVDINVNGGTWALSGATQVSDDIFVTGSNAKLILNGTGFITSNATNTGSGLYIRSGGTVSLAADNPFDSTLDYIIFDIGPGTLETNGYTFTTPRLDLGGRLSGYEGTINGTSGTIVVGNLNLYGGTVNSKLSGTGAVSKYGPLTVTLKGNNSGLTSTTATRVDEGTLVLDYTASNTAKLPTAAGLDLRGGTLTIVGSDTAATSQTVLGITLASGGPSKLNVHAGSGQKAVLNTTTLTRTAGTGTLQIDLPSGPQDDTNGVRTTNANSAFGMWGAAGFATVTDDAGTWFATASGAGPTYNIVALASTAKDDVTTWLADEHITDDTGFTGTRASSISINSLRFDATTGAAANLGAGAGLTVASGGILVTSAVTGGTPKIAGGRLGSSLGVAELIVHQNSAQLFEISSGIGFGESLTKSGAGTLLLSGANSYTGATRILEGTLQVSGGNAIGDRSRVTLDDTNANTLELLASETIGYLEGGGATAGSIYGTVAIGSHTLTLNHSDFDATPNETVTFAGVITGDGTLVKKGDDSLALTGANAFTGTVVINDGRIDISGNTGGTLNAASTIVLNGPTELLIRQDQDSDRDRIGNGANLALYNTAGTGTAFTSRNGTRLYTSHNSARTENIGPIEVNAGHNLITAEPQGGTSARATLAADTLTRSNRSTLLVRGLDLGSATATRQGVVVFDAGSQSVIDGYEVGGGGAAGTTTISIIPWIVGSITNTGYGESLVTNVDATKGLRPLATSEYVTNAAGYNALTGNTWQNVRFDTNPGAPLTGTATAINSLVLDGASAMTITGPASTLQINSGAILSAQAVTNVIDGFTTITAPTGRDYTVFVTDPAGSLTINSNLSSNRALVKSGSGSLILGVNSNFTDLYFNQGSVQVDSLAKLGTGALYFYGGVLKWDPLGTAFDPSAKSITLGPGGAVFDTNGLDVVFNSAIGNSGVGSFTKSGAGSLTLKGAAGWTGSTTVNGGSLIMGAANSISTGDLTVSGGSTLGMATYSRTVASLTMSGGSGANAITGTGTLTVTGDAILGGGSIGPSLAGAMNLNKTTANETLILASNNTYTGETVISAGMLRVNSANGIPGGLATTGGTNALVFNGGVLGLGASDFSRGLGVGAADVRFTGSGGFAAYGADRVVNLGGASAGVTWGSGWFVPTGSTLIFSASDATHKVTFTNPIDLGTAVRTIQVDNGSAAVDAELTGDITGTAGNLTKTGAGMLVLTGSESFTGQLIVSNGGMRVTNSLANPGNSTTVGNAATSLAVLDIGPAATLTTNTISLGTTAGGVGVLNIRGGTASTTNVTTNAGITVGTSGYGGFFLSGGSFTANRFSQYNTDTAGAYSVAQISGGELTVKEYLIISNNRSEFTVTGGTVLHNAASQDIAIAYNKGGTSVFTVAGGTVDNSGRNVSFGAVGATATNTGVLNLDSGLLITNSIVGNATTGTSAVNFAGGTLKANIDSATFINANVRNVYVNGAFGTYTGGAVIDTNGKNVTIAKGLLAPTGDGVTSVTGLVGGSGYLGAPYVEITGGGGTGATGYAVVDNDPNSATYGQVTSVVITNPGVNYTSTPTITLLGGGGAGASVTAVTGTNTSGGLTKQGLGALTLGATGTYTGLTTVNEGALVLGVLNAIPDGNDVTVAGGTLNLGTFAKSFDVIGLTSGSIIGTGSLTTTQPDFTLEAGSVDVSLIGGVGLIKSGTGTLFVNKANTYTGQTSIDAGMLTATHGAALGATGGGTIVADGATLGLQGNITLTEAAISLTGDGSAAGVGALLNISGDNVVTGDITVTAAGTRIKSDVDTLLISGNIATNGSGNFNIGGEGDIEVSGVISGTLNLFKSSTGAGTLTLSGENTYTGTTVIANGTVRVASIGSVGSTSSNLGAPTDIAAATIGMGSGANGGTLLYVGTGETTDRVVNLRGTTASAVIDHSGTGLLKFTSDFTATGAGSKTLTLQGSTAGEGEIAGAIVNNSATNTTSLVKTGTGGWTLSGAAANTFTGSTTVSGGTLTLAKTGSPNTAILGDGVAGTTDIFIDGGTLRLAASEQIANDAGILLSAGALNFGAASGLTETVGEFTNTGGDFSTGANTFIGTGSSITWAGGTNTVNADGTVQDAHVVITGGTNTVEGQGAGATGGTLHVQSGGAGLEFGGTASPALTLNPDDGIAGRLLLEGGVTVLGTLTSGTAQILSDNSAANPGYIDMAAGTRTFNINDGSADVDMLITASIQNGGLTKTGDGTLVLGGSHANTYLGDTSVLDGNMVLNKTAGVTAIAGNIVLGSASGNGLEILTLGSSGQIASTSVITFHGEISTDMSTLDAGALRLNGFNQTLGGIQSSTLYHGAIVNDSATTDAVLTVNTAAGDNQVYMGWLLDKDLVQHPAYTTTLGLNKTGAGSLTLSNPLNLYSGGTTVSAGTLLVNNTAGSATGTGVVTVKDTATLGGTGSIGGGIVVEQGGTLAPGSAAGVIGNLTSGGDVDFNPTTNPGGTFKVDIALDIDGVTVLADKLIVQGTHVVDITNSILDLPTLWDGPETASPNQYLTIIDNVDDASTLVGYFANRPPTGGVHDLGWHYGSNWYLYYNVDAATQSLEFNSGNDLVITNVPEPSTLALLAGAALTALGGVFWRRRKQVAVKREEDDSDAWYELEV